MVFFKKFHCSEPQGFSSQEVTGSERRGQSRAPDFESTLHKNSPGESDRSTETPKQNDVQSF